MIEMTFYNEFPKILSTIKSIIDIRNCNLVNLLKHKHMKKIIGLLAFTFISFGMNAQSVIGAWEAYHTSENGEKLKSVLIFSEGYQVLTTYEAVTGKFIH